MRQCSAVVDFIDGIVLHDPAHEDGCAERRDDKADVSAYEVERVKDVAAENSHVAPCAVGKNAGNVAEHENTAEGEIDGAAQAHAQAFDKHADDDLVDRQRGRQRCNHEQHKEHDGKEVAAEHFGKCNRQRLEYQRGAGVGGQVGAKQSREDHEAGHHGNQRVDDACHDGSLDHVFLLVQVRRQSDHDAEAERQGKEHLAQNVKEQAGCDLGEVRSQIKANAFGCVLKREIAHNHDEKTQQQKRHQIFDRAFNALDDALAQNYPVDQNKDERAAGNRQR